MSLLTGTVAILCWTWEINNHSIYYHNSYMYGIAKYSASHGSGIRIYFVGKLWQLRHTFYVKISLPPPAEYLA